MNVGRLPGSTRAATNTTVSEAGVESDCSELDCPWFDPNWLLAHPDFPLGPVVIEKTGEDQGDSQWGDIASTPVTARSA